MYAAARSANAEPKLFAVVLRTAGQTDEAGQVAILSNAAKSPGLPTLLFVLACLPWLAGCGPPQPGLEPGAGVYDAFGLPERVVIRGYEGDAMEPFLTRDGRYLLFNNLNSPAVDTNLHYAERIDDRTFEYRGEILQVNSAALEAVPSMDIDGLLYFVSDRSYSETLTTLYHGRFSEGQVVDVEPLLSLSRRQPGQVNFDVEVSPDGNTLYFVDSRFDASGTPRTADIVIAVRRDGEFVRLANSDELMRRVNTAALEYAMAISTNGLELFFTRVEAISESAQPAIFRAVRKSPAEPFGAPALVSSLQGFVEAPAFSADDKDLYFHRRENGRYVLYWVTR